MRKEFYLLVGGGILKSAALVQLLSISENKGTKNTTIPNRSVQYYVGYVAMKRRFKNSSSSVLVWCPCEDKGDKRRFIHYSAFHSFKAVSSPTTVWWLIAMPCLLEDWPSNLEQEMPAFCGMQISHERCCVEYHRDGNGTWKYLIMAKWDGLFVLKSLSILSNLIWIQILWSLVGFNTLFSCPYYIN